MAGVYKLDSGQRALPEAEAEAKSLIKDYNAVALSSTTQSLKQLVDATLSHGLPPQEIGGVGAVHFAGHGDFNPANPDASVMLLSNGMPMPSAIFRDAKYGGDQQPLIFLNACMIGIGGQLLGDMGGFPGSCLKGGFGGVLGALWEVNDKVAREVALEFWHRVLPRDGSQPEPVAAVLRDLRAQYDHDSPVPTYLSYVYYGHPRLTLQRVT
jgi:CHAT domain-containing protein